MRSITKKGKLVGTCTDQRTIRALIHTVLIPILGCVSERIDLTDSHRPTSESSAIPPRPGEQDLNQVKSHSSSIVFQTQRGTNVHPVRVFLPCLPIIFVN